MTTGTLELVRGNTTPFRVELDDGAGNAELVTGVEAARVSIRASSTSTPVLSIALGAKLVAHQGTNAKNDPSWFEVKPAQADADALVPGVYVGVLSARYAGQWQDSHEFTVEVRPAHAEHVA